jgi:hypothetical protein
VVITVVEVFDLGTASEDEEEEEDEEAANGKINELRTVRSSMLHRRIEGNIYNCVSLS